MLLMIFKSHGNNLLIPNIEPLKYKYQIGLETLVVFTMNKWALYVNFYLLVYTLTLKCLAWGV